MRRNRSLVALTVVTAVSLLVITVAGASHDFNDVGTDHPFHDDISLIADAGITTGFADGGYHPGDPVTRQSMAAFLSRGLTRVGYDEGSASVNSSASNTLATVEMERGAAGDAASMGFYVVTATVAVTTENVGSCPCTVSASVDAPGEQGDRGATGVLAVPNDNSGRPRTNLTIHTVVPAGPDLPDAEFTLRALAFRNIGSGEPTYGFVGTLSVIYVPFGFDGTQTLAPAP